MDFYCIECGENIHCGDVEEYICPHCHKKNMVMECENCSKFFAYRKDDDEIICPSCGYNYTTDEDDGADLFPNGRDSDSEDEDTFGGI
jgi:DNA-directed RNA polymerase subunit RPC12/RpoP